MATLQGSAYQTTPSWIDLPEPTEVKVTDEIIWSSNAGRNTDKGTMSGDIKARKYTVEITWSMLTSSEQNTIRTWVDGSDGKRKNVYLRFPYEGSTKQIRAYRGTATRTLLPADKTIAKSLEMTLIEW